MYTDDYLITTQKKVLPALIQQTRTNILILNDGYM